MRLIILMVLILNILEAEPREALLIGNSNYKHLEVLSSPSQDIPALANKLRGMHFEVTELYDLDEKQMKKAIKSFKQKLYQNPNAISLFYYSGHGSQAYGESYLIPVDGDTRDQADVEADGVKVETIARKMANAKTKANILFLDACRDVPTGTMGNGTKGLGQVKRQPSSTLILYSTGKNKTASDDRVFNKTVLEKLALNMPFSSLANDISYAVGQKTDRKQIPELLSTGLPVVCLSGQCKNNEVKVVEKIVKCVDIINELEMIKNVTITIKAVKGFRYIAKEIHREKLLNEFIKKVDIFINSFSYVEFPLVNPYCLKLSKITKDSTITSIHLNDFREKVILDYKDKLKYLSFEFIEIKGCDRMATAVSSSYIDLKANENINNSYLTYKKMYIECLKFTK